MAPTPIKQSPMLQQPAQGLPQSKTAVKAKSNEPATTSVLKTETGVKDIAKAKSETGQIVHVKVNQTHEEIAAHKEHTSDEMEKYLQKKPLKKAHATKSNTDEACVKK